MKHLIAAILTLSLSSCVMRATPHFQVPDRRLADLQREQTKLKGLSDPVAFTKTSIRISEILLSFVSDAVKKGDVEVMEQRLSEYVSAIQNAHQTLVKTGRDAHKRPGGFKELEIAIRRQLIQLKDIGGALTLDEREPVDKAREQVADIRDALFKSLFGSQNVTPGN